MGSLQLALLTMQPDNPSCRAIKEAAKNRGHQITVLSTLDYADNKNGPHPEQFDAVIPRIGPEITEQGMSALRRFETSGVYNSSKMVLDVLEQFLVEIQENERLLQKLAPTV